MKQNTAKQIKLDVKGEVDVQYYIDQAHLMRAHQMAEYKQELKTWLLSHLHLNELKFLFNRLVHH